jgi:hypothetical protein
LHADEGHVAEAFQRHFGMCDCVHIAVTNTRDRRRKCRTRLVLLW